MTIGVFAGLILLCCVVGYFFGIPRLQDNIADSLSDELSTQVSIQFADMPASAGTYTLDVTDLQQQLQENIQGQNVDDVELSIDDTGRVKLSITSSEQEIGYEGTVTAENGELVIEDMESNNDVLGFFLPADKLADAVEKGVNEYFQNQGLRIESVTPGTNQLTFEVVED
jgi:hypothetical protein